MSTTIAALYKTRFHRDVVFTSFTFNPDLPLATIQEAIYANDPEKFLPQPWPPIRTDDVPTLKALTLTKMKHRVCLGTDLGRHHAVILGRMVASQYPRLWDHSAGELKMFEAWVFLGVNGTPLSFNYRIPESGMFPYSANLMDEQEGINRFVVLMLAHGLSLMLEAGDL